MNLRETISSKVSSLQGCKLSQLVAEKEVVLAFLNSPEHAEGEDLINIIVDMIDDGDLLEIEYILPEMGYRIKSFILPGETKILT